MGVLHVGATVYHIYTWYPGKPEGSIGFLGTGITDNFEPPHGCWVKSPNLRKNNQCS